jgi:hypothetical protein
MFKNLIAKLFGNNNNKQVEIPKAFREKKKSIFLNKYAGLIYFIVVWHAFGYILISTAKSTADKQGSFEFFSFYREKKSSLS